MAKYDTIEALEAAARAKLKEARAVEADWTPTRAAILNVFHALPMHSYPADRVCRIATAIEDTAFSINLVQQNLTKLARGGFLRSRLERGIRFYEVNV